MDTGIRTDRIEAVREIVSGMLEQVPDVSLRASGYVHIFGVADACVLLAMKRDEDIELAAVAGYLHDIATYTTGITTPRASVRIMRGAGQVWRGAFSAGPGFFQKKRLKPSSVQFFITAIRKRYTDRSMRFSKTQM